MDHRTQRSAKSRTGRAADVRPGSSEQAQQVAASRRAFFEKLQCEFHRTKIPAPKPTKRARRTNVPAGRMRAPEPTIQKLFSPISSRFRHTFVTGSNPRPAHEQYGTCPVSRLTSAWPVETSRLRTSGDFKKIFRVYTSMMRTKRRQSFVAQRHHWVNQHRTARRNVRCQQRNYDQQARNGRKGQRIARRHAKQHAPHQLRQSQRRPCQVRESQPCFRDAIECPVLINAVISMGRRNTKLEPTWH
jgi:hypothetical protein